jgi:hypothetical protein
MSNIGIRKLKPLIEDELRTIDPKSDFKLVSQTQKLNALKSATKEQVKQNSNTFKNKLSPLDLSKSNTEVQESPRVRENHSAPSSPSPSEPVYSSLRRKSLTPIGM